MIRLTAIAMFSLGLVSSPAWAEPTAEEARNTQVVLDVFKAFETRDLAVLKRSFADEGTIQIGLTDRPYGGPHETFEAAAPFPGALEGVTVEVEKILAEDDEVAIQSLICGAHAAPILGYEPTGKRLCSRYINLYVLKDGKIISNSVGLYRDQLTEQLEENKEDR